MDPPRGRAFPIHGGGSIARGFNNKATDRRVWNVAAVNGYVLFHRNLLNEHPAFRNDAEALAFAWLFARASWKPARVRYKGRTISLNRGQLATSIRDMAHALDRDKGWVERLLKRLKAEAMIEIRAETHASVITISNYDKFQFSADGHETPQRTPDEGGARRARGTEKRRKEGKEKHSVSPKPVPRAADFDVPEWVPIEQWNAFCEMRRQKGAEVSGYVARRLFEQLAGIAADGWDISRVLDKATVNCWNDLRAPTPGRDENLRSPWMISDPRPPSVGRAGAADFSIAADWTKKAQFLEMVTCSPETPPV